MMISPQEIREVPELKKKGTVIVFPSTMAQSRTCH